MSSSNFSLETKEVWISEFTNTLHRINMLLIIGSYSKGRENDRRRDELFMIKMDLHMHSICSDGERSPVELVELAVKNRLTVISITDHDTISAYEEAELKAKKLGIQLISGIELNTMGPMGELHILGYGIDLGNEALQAYCYWRKKERISWGLTIVEKLYQLGYRVSWEKCFARATGGVIVRTHIADELVEQGYFESSEVAFHSLLTMDQPAYVERTQFTTKEAIDLIHASGGLAFIAHPGIYKFPWSLDALVEEGIDGIEVFYAKHDEIQTTDWIEKAKNHQLYMSVGSDFHGETSRNPQMIGTVPYDENAVHSWVTKLRQLEVEIF